MFRKTVIYFFLLLITSASLYAQVGRKGKESSKKANRRPAAEAKETPNPSNERADAAVAADDDEIISVDTNLVTIPVRVMDRQGRFVGGLKKSDFEVFEDKVRQQISYFSNEQNPFTVALVLDMSYSSTFKIDEIQQAALTFITELRPRDKVMVLSFDEGLHILCEPTSDRKIISGAIVRTNISSGTSLYEAVDFVINKRFNAIPGRKAIVLFTDGVDTTSRRVGGRKNLRDASELDALIYPIRYDTFADVQAIESGKIIISDDKRNPRTTPPIGGGSIPSTRNTNPFPFPIPTGAIRTGRRPQTSRIPGGQGTTREEYRRAEEYLDKMASLSGGRVYEANNPGNLARAFTRIASELREFYSLGYYPNEDSGKPRVRRLKVKVSVRGVAVRARESYILRQKEEKDRRKK